MPSFAPPRPLIDDERYNAVVDDAPRRPESWTPSSPEKCKVTARQTI
jgi:hypothetical protein